ncbi:MAG: insulinase family protein [Bryobacteraceae bacterium]|nr:insulinase family protein [Bryobacteraceae bacterium]
MSASTVRTRFACLLAAVLLASACFPAAAQSGAPRKVTSVEGITEYRLDNGLRVLLFPDPTKSTITVNVTYMVGSRHEDYGETGMAHLLEHLLFMGSKNHPDIKKELQDRGARPNGTTWYDRTNYFETFAATEDNLAWALSMEADRMVNSFVAKKDLDSEMTVVRNEMEAGENAPQRVLLQRVLATAFEWHNYGKLTIGARSDVERVPIERLQAFYRHFYQPDNALLVVAGKFDEQKALALIQKTFGAIPKPQRQLRRTYTVEPAQDGERQVVVRRVGDVQYVGAAWHIPPGSHEEFPAIEMAVAILGDQPSGRLYKALVETKKAATVSMNAFQLHDPGFAYASASVRMDSPLEDARKALLDTIAEIRSKPFTKDELERQRTRWLKNFELQMNDPQDVALELSEWQAMGDWRLMFLQRDRIEKVTLEQVQKAAEKYFIPSNCTVGLFIPEKEPVRVQPPEPPDVQKLVEGYTGRAVVSQGEAFEATPANIDRRTIRGEIGGGLKLALLPKKTRGSQVTAVLSLHFGDENNLRDKVFIGGLAGQMLMRGTTKKTRQQIRDEIDRIKAQINVGGNASGASARITTTRENLPAAIDLVFEMLKESAFPENEFDQLKRQVLASLESAKSQPQTIASVALQRHLMPWPKGDIRSTPTIEEQIEGIQAATLDQVKEFYAQYYGLAEAELAIIGDFDPEAVQQQVARHVRDWKSRQNYARVLRRFKPVQPAAGAFETPDKANAMWMAGAALKLKDTDPDYPALIFGNYLLGQGMNSRLFARIRNKEGLSYGVGSQVIADSDGDHALFIAFAICAPENAPKVEASFRDEMRKVLTEGFTAEEIEAGKKSWLQSRQVSRENDDELVQRLVSRTYERRTMAFDAELEEKVKALTPEQVRAAMAKYLDPAGLTYMRAGDFRKVNVTW